MFWIWARGGPTALLAFVGVVIAFIGLFLLGSLFEPWVGPVLVVSFFAGLLYVLWRIDPRRREGPPEAGSPDER